MQQGALDAYTGYQHARGLIASVYVRLWPRLEQAVKTTGYACVSPIIYVLHVRALRLGWLGLAGAGQDGRTDDLLQRPGIKRYATNTEDRNTLGIWSGVVRGEGIRPLFSRSKSDPWITHRAAKNLARPCAFNASSQVLRKPNKLNLPRIRGILPSQAASVRRMCPSEPDIDYGLPGSSPGFRAAFLRRAFQGGPFRECQIKWQQNIPQRNQHQQ